MAAGDKTTKYVKISVEAETGEINYAEETYIEDADGVNQKIGGLHRPGVVPPRVRNATDTGWKDNVITSKPKVIRDIAGVVWTSDVKTAYENKNS